MKNLAAKGVLGALAMGAAIFATTPAAHAQGFAAEVQFGAPAYSYSQPTYDAAPGYYGEYPGRDAYLRHEQHEAMERREAFARHEQIEHAREFNRWFDRDDRRFDRDAYRGR